MPMKIIMGLGLILWFAANSWLGLALFAGGLAMVLTEKHDG